MKRHRLYIMRHAKSAWNTDAPTDHQRPLKKRGRRDAQRMGLWLAESQAALDLVCMSDSTRTRQTYQQLGLSPALPALTAACLYHGGLSEIAAASGDWPCTARRVLVLGHNPGWEDAVEALAGQFVRMATSTIAVVETDARGWADAFERQWRLLDVVGPKSLR